MSEWRETNEVIAKYVVKGEKLGWLRREKLTDKTIGPGEVAVLIRDGKIEDVLTQTRVKKLDGWFGKSMDEKMLFIDTAPVELQLYVSAKSKDYVPINGTCTLRYKVNMDDAPSFINLMGGAKVLTKTELVNKLRSEVAVNVFSNKISKHTADEFHGNLDLIKGMETAADVEMRKTFDMYGLTLIKMFTEWAPSKYEAVKTREAVTELEEKEREAAYKPVTGELKRVHEVEKLKQEQRKELEVGEVQREEAGRTERTAAAMTREEIENMQRMKERQREIDLQLEKERKEDVQDAEQIAKLVELKGKMKEQKIKEYQGTELEKAKLEAEVEKEKAKAEVEKEKYKLDTYKEAEERERKHEVERRKADAELMQAAKQEVPHTLVQGAERPTPVVRIEPGEEYHLKCPHCGEPLKKGWKVCPSCKESL